MKNSKKSALSGPAVLYYYYYYYYYGYYYYYYYFYYDYYYYDYYYHYHYHYYPYYYYYYSYYYYYCYYYLPPLLLLLLLHGRPAGHSGWPAGRYLASRPAGCRRNSRPGCPRCPKLFVFLKEEQRFTSQEHQCSHVLSLGKKSQRIAFFCRF